MSEAPIADQAAIARVGAAVRARLATDPSVYRIPVERAEVFAVQEFLSPAECEHIMEMVDSAARPSTMFVGFGGEGDRTSYSGDVDPRDSFVRMVERRICDLMGLKESWGETFQGQRYEKGQLFKGHYDFFNTDTEYWPRESKMGGQRCWTAMVYLNEVEEGGATDFSLIGLSVPPQAGMLMMWNNALPDGRPNRDTYHTGTAVVRGVKYVITKWFRTRPWG
jgi:prolyl 4-hydroxylase